MAVFLYVAACLPAVGDTSSCPDAGTFYTVNQGTPSQLWQLDGGGQVLERCNIVLAGGGTLGQVHGLAFDDEGVLWGAGPAGCGTSQCLLEFEGAPECDGGTVIVYPSPLRKPNGNNVEGVGGMEPYVDGTLLLLDKVAGGQVFVFDPRNPDDIADHGHLAPSDAHGIARLSTSGTQFWALESNRNLHTAFLDVPGSKQFVGPIECPNGTSFRNLGGLTGASDGFLWGFDHQVRDSIFRIDPATAVVQCESPLSTSPHHADSLAYHYPCGGGPWVDCDENRIPDSCDILSGVPDCNEDGVPDSCSVASGESEDCNGNGTPDDCELVGDDCNMNGIPDSCELQDKDCDDDGVPDDCQLSGNDCNSNGVPDNCDVEESDCDDNGAPDDCQLDDNDCNTNLVPDNCELVGNDCQGDGTPDDCQLEFDCNMDFIPDGCQLEFDCNMDLVPDECQLEGNDCDGDLVPDDCQLADNDCNRDGIPDWCQLEDNDCNGNEKPDDCDVARPKVHEVSPVLSPFGDGFTQSFTIVMPPLAYDEVVARFTAYSDLLSDTFESATAELNGFDLGVTLFEEMGRDCPDEPDVEEVVLSAETFNAVVSGADATFEVAASSLVDPFFCQPESWIQIELEYDEPSEYEDLDGNGVPDVCEPPPIRIHSPQPGIPGQFNSFLVTGAGSGATVAVARGLEEGTTPLPGCIGHPLGIGDATLLAHGVADSSGDVTLTVFVPSTASGRELFFQAADLDSCDLSDVVTYLFP